jgi:hypothetical protein
MPIVSKRDKEIGKIDFLSPDQIRQRLDLEGWSRICMNQIAEILAS